MRRLIAILSGALLATAAWAATNSLERAAAAPCGSPQGILVGGELRISGTDCSEHHERLYVYCSGAIAGVVYYVDGIDQGDTNLGVPCAAATSVVVSGREGDDELQMTAVTAANGFTALAGANRLLGEGGDDLLIGSPTRDSLSGGDGDDLLQPQAGNDSAAGGDGDDEIEGGDGNDSIFGDAGEDRMDGGGGNDAAVGGSDEDRINGADGDDAVDGGGGDDVLLGLGGRDRLRGLAGIDFIRGGAARDRLLGGTGTDLLVGGADRDLLRGGPGRDLLIQ